MKVVQNPVSKIIASGFLVMGIILPASVMSAGNQEEPFVYLVKYDITGSPNQDGSFTIGGPGYSTITTSSGEVLDNIVPGLEVSQLTGAEIVFSGALTDPVILFTCRTGTCNITLGGSTFTSDAGVPLDGRVVPMWGPVINSNFNPDGSSTPVRILGCGGLKEISNEGDFAGMAGSICFNGVFNLPDFQTNFSLSGGSDCTITLHTPVVPIP
jgi:hypothetical protein